MRIPNMDCYCNLELYVEGAKLISEIRVQIKCYTSLFSWNYCNFSSKKICMLFFEKRKLEMSLLLLLVFRYIRKRDVVARGSVISTQSFALTQGSPASSAWRNGAEGEHCTRVRGGG
jgi:hypothetical protein